jgi:hypothetical protein
LVAEIPQIVPSQYSMDRYEVFIEFNPVKWQVETAVFAEFMI